MWVLRTKMNVVTFAVLMAVVAVHITWGQEVPMPEDIDEDQIKKTAEIGEKALKDKCLNVSGSDQAFEDLKGGKDKLMECVQDIVNVTKFKEELDDAKKRGAMEEVFGKYCKKKPELLSCVTDFTKTVEVCLKAEEKETVKIVMNLTESLLDFMCYKDGDRVAMFIAEGGFKCIEEKKTEIQECVNTTFGDVAPKSYDVLSMGELMIIDDKKCDEFTKLQQCVTRKLEGCENQTPANVVESLFKYIKKSLPCSSTTAPQQSGEVHLFEYNRVKRQLLIGNELENKCRMNSKMEWAYQDLNVSFSQFVRCFKDNMLMKSPDSCSESRRTTELCAEEFYPKLKRCLLPKEDFFVDFIKDAIKAVLDFGCNDNGKNIKDFLMGEGLKCLSNSESSHNFKGCVLRGDKHKMENGQMIIEKESLCKDIGNVKMCIVEHIKHSECSKHQRFLEIVDGFMDSVRSPCSASSIFVNLTLMFGVLYYHLQKYLF